MPALDVIIHVWTYNHHAMGEACTRYSVKTYGATQDDVYIGCMGGVDRTFASKSRECLWQDWYIFPETSSLMACLTKGQVLLENTIRK